MQHEGLLLPEHGCCGCWKSLLWWSRPHPWTTPLLESWASVYSGAQTNEQIGLDKSNRYGLLKPAHSADAAHIQRSTQDNDPHHLRDQPCGCLWRDSSQNTVKYPHKIAASELIVLGLCCACSLQMYRFPKGDSWQKHTYDNLGTLCSENTRDKFPLSCHCHTLHHMPSDVGEFSPGEALHVYVDLTTVHTLVRFWVGPSQQMTLQTTRSMRKSWHVHCTHANLCRVLLSVANTYEHLL